MCSYIPSVRRNFLIISLHRWYLTTFIGPFCCCCCCCRFNPHRFIQSRVWLFSVIHLSAPFEISLGIIIILNRWTLIVALNIELDQKYLLYSFVPFLFCPCKKQDSKNCNQLYDVGVASCFFFSSYIRLPSKFLQFFPRKFPKLPAITIIKSYHKMSGPKQVAFVSKTKSSKCYEKKNISPK
jgi:hypothetical protein